jgi:Uma2 family endonuclease
MSAISTNAYAEMIPVPRIALRFPVELPVPDGFVVDRVETWPRTEGELEYVGGRLLYMPPSADRQQDTSADVVTVLGTWRKQHPGFTVAGNEAGMILGGEARGADAAVWRKEDVGAHQGRYRPVPPILAVEVQGELEDEATLRAKAAWYLDRGVELVWLLFPSQRRIVVITRVAGRNFALGERLPEHPSLPGLTPTVDELFDQIIGG